MKQPEDIYTIDLAFKRKGELDMFAYFKTRDLILPDWVNYSLTRQRLSGVINSYFVADNSLKSY